MPGTSAQRAITRGALVVILVAVVWVAVPFKDGAHTCYPAVWSAFRDDREYSGLASTRLVRGRETVEIFCEAQARRRLATSGVVIGLAVVAYVVGRRAFIRPDLDRASSN